MIGDILQPTHLLFLLVVALLVLGPKRLPEMAKTLGTGLRDFRSAISGEDHDRDTITEPRSQPVTDVAETSTVADVPGAFGDEPPDAEQASPSDSVSVRDATVVADRPTEPQPPTEEPQSPTAPDAQSHAPPAQTLSRTRPAPPDPQSPTTPDPESPTAPDAPSEPHATSEPDRPSAAEPEPELHTDAELAPEQRA